MPACCSLAFADILGFSWVISEEVIIYGFLASFLAFTCAAMLLGFTCAIFSIYDKSIIDASVIDAAVPAAVPPHVELVL